MNIAIVDDLKADRDILSSKIKEFMKGKNIPFDLYEFDCAETFLKTLVTGYFKIVFMDIFLKQQNGMDAAKDLYHVDKNCKIIFLTTSRDYSQKGYAVRAVHYLLKPIDPAEFIQAMKFCEVLPKYDVPILTVLVDGIPMEINTDKILFIEYRERRTHIELLNRDIAVSAAFSEVIKPLQTDRRFLNCIRGLIVNMQHIHRQEEDAFVLTTGHRLPINIRGKKVAVEAYRKYVFREMEGLK